MLFMLLFIAAIVGALIGTVGVGGILLIPALSACANLSTHSAMATALFSFFFTGILGTWLYQRYGSINWHVTIPVCIGAFLGGWPGSLVNAMASGRLLDFLLGIVIIFAGLYALLPAGYQTLSRPFGKWAQLILIGGAVGFGSGLTGVGGPVLSVPLMVILGFSPITAIATSQAIQITAALSGTIGNISNGFISWGISLPVTFAELIGVIIGARIAHIVPQKILKKIISLVCVIIGGFIISHSLFF